MLLDTVSPGHKLTPEVENVPPSSGVVHVVVTEVHVAQLLGQEGQLRLHPTPILHPVANEDGLMPEAHVAHSPL